MPPAAGGQTVWAELPDPVCSRLVVAARRRGLDHHPRTPILCRGGGERHLRLPFTAPIPVLGEAVARLARAWAHIDPTSGPDGGAEPYDLIS